MHIEINDFSTLNEQYGYDFGDKVLSAFGHALNEAFGIRSIVGRYAGRNFTVLQQIESREEAAGLRMKIKDVGNSVREIDGKPVTLYLSVGYKDLKSVPVIVLTIDHKAELECLKLGAMDFIPKPYPDIEIVKARIAKCIALSGKN